MLSHRPSIVLVEKNVSGCAMQMLQHAGVTLISNIKSGVLQRVARSTGADVMPSLDAQLLNQKTGFCPYFKQEKIRLANGKVKCLLVRFCFGHSDLKNKTLLKFCSMKLSCA